MKNSIEEILRKRQSKKAQVSLTLNQDVLNGIKKEAKRTEVPLSQFIDSLLWIYLQELPEMEAEKMKIKKAYSNPNKEDEK